MKPKYQSIPLKLCLWYFLINLVLTIILYFTIKGSEYRYALLGDLFYNSIGISIMLFAAGLFISALDFSKKNFIIKLVPLLILFFLFAEMGINHSYQTYSDWFDEPVCLVGTLEFVEDTGKTSWRSKVDNFEFKVDTSPIVFKDCGDYSYIAFVKDSVRQKVQVDYSPRLKKVIRFMRYQ